MILNELATYNFDLRRTLVEHKKRKFQRIILNVPLSCRKCLQTKKVATVPMLDCLEREAFGTHTDAFLSRFAFFSEKASAKNFFFFFNRSRT